MADCTVDRLLPGVWRACCDLHLALLRYVHLAFAFTVLWTLEAYV